MKVILKDKILKSGLSIQSVHPFDIAWIFDFIYCRYGLAFHFC